MDSIEHENSHKFRTDAVMVVMSYNFLIYKES